MIPSIIPTPIIPVCEPTLNGNELKYVEECVKDNWISSSGKYLPLFEQKFSSYCQAKYGVACCNGTVALHLALRVLNIKPGDEVIVPDFTMMASVDAILYVGAKPVFIDAEPDTWNMDVKQIRAKITPNTKAIMPVHIYGHPVDMDPLLEIAKEHHLYVIEDAAEAHGAEYKGKRVGCLGDIGCFSFYANKIITTGEGGMVVTNNPELAEKAKLLRNLAFTEPRFLHYELGYNYRMTNIQAALGVAQMEYADKLTDARRNNAKKYNQLLSKIPGLTLPVEKPWAKNVYWMYGLLVEEDFGMSMPEVRKKLLEKGVDTRTFFLPMHSQPLILKLFPEYKLEQDKYPISDTLARKGLYLPSSSHLTEEQIKEVAEALMSLSKKK